MSKLYYSERGHVVPVLCEELTTYRRARKVLHLPGTRSPADLYLLARPYPHHGGPLHISVNGVEVQGPVSDGDPSFHWFRVTVPPDLLRSGANVLDFWTDAHAMDGWSMALEDGHRDPESRISTDGGATWRDEGMGYMGVCRGEYVARLRLEEGSDPAPPAFVWESRSSPRLERLRQRLPAEMLSGGPTLDRVRALATWVCTQWFYRCQGGAYAPWDAETILSWGKQGRGHDGREPIVMCVHYAVTLTTACLAVGIPARYAVFCGDVNQPNGHFCAEVWMEEAGKWVLVDPTLDAVLFRDDEPMSVTEIQQAGDDLAPLIRWGPGWEWQKENPVVGPWVPRTFLNGLCFRHRSIWPRVDLLSRPELGPAWHGSTSYCETDLVWEQRDLARGMGMFASFADAAYFDTPPQGWDQG